MRRWAARWHRTDQSGSMPLAILLTLVVTTASTVALPVVISQVTSTRITVRSGDALQAAQDGLEAAVAAVRVAVADNSYAELPCGPITRAATVATGAGYSASLTYYGGDPSTATSTGITCANVTASKPSFVRITSTGTPRTSTKGEGRRTLRGDLEIRFAVVTTAPATTVAPTTTTATISLAPTPSATWGPQYDDLVNPRPILAYTTTRDDKKCLDPGSAKPAAGTVVTLQTCTADNVQDNNFQQNWYYQSNLTLSTVSGILSGNPMCLDAGLVPAPGAKVTMQPCVTPIVPPNQRWYYNNYGNYELAAATGTGYKLSGMCLNVQTAGSVGSPIVLGTGAKCRSATPNSTQTFSTYTKIGPGEAGSRTNDCTKDAGYPCIETQLVNNGMPSRCIDQYTTFMANLECAQDPDLDNVKWTQLYRLPQWADGTTGVNGPIVAVDAKKQTYCLTTATTWPTLTTCNPKSPTAAQKWTIYRRTGNDFTQYRIIDANGKCLTHPNGTSSTGTSAQFYWNQASYHWKLIVDTCVNTNTSNTADVFNQASVLRRQKWNAPMLLSNKTPTATTAPATVAPTTAAPTVTTQPPATPSPTPSPSSSAVDATPLDGTTLPLRNVVEIKPTP
ncbi:ricin-type beta-trefoil lectin domain protein [Actinoplanes sp. CA-030573]|uniref:ricin-type beta-trefoil lectin domain protein n=1 Tax=Actinoplanes sp. CA-030573 TaxID=3239898 RepID=UPI003D94F37F